MIANYHTHTWRCRHADGTEREYVERAIEGGLKILGFSDHSPYPFPDGYDSGMRMRLDQVEGYARFCWRYIFKMPSGLPGSQRHFTW